MNEMKQSQKKRIVIKIGSSSLVNHQGGLSKDKLNHYVKAIAQLKDAGHELIIVSSGAVAAGFTLLGYSARPSNIEGKQAAAAVGQGLLIQAYNEAFHHYHYTTAQILITRQDFAKRQQYINAYHVLSELLKRGVIPIINENDSVAVDELTFGDNDLLSSLVAGLIHADHLFILTDIDGLYDLNPKTHPHAKRFKQVDVITPEMEQMAGVAGSSFGTGGMRSKLAAAKLALSLGVHVFIGKAKGEQALVEILSGNGEGTYFGQETLSTLKTKKQWIAFHSEAKGQIVIDQGAAEALTKKGKSLLPAGVVYVKGRFSSGQVVEVAALNGSIIGKGLVYYSSSQLNEVLGYSTDDAKRKLNLEREEVIHQDDWVTLMETKGEEVYA